MLSKALQNALRHFSHYELVVVADKLSENCKRWKYSKKSIANVVNAISENVSDDTLILALEDLWGAHVHSRVLHEEVLFPPTLQFGKTIIGPLGLFTVATQRKKYDALETN